LDKAKLSKFLSVEGIKTNLKGRIHYGKIQGNTVCTGKNAKERKTMLARRELMYKSIARRLKRKEINCEKQ